MLQATDQHERPQVERLTVGTCNIMMHYCIPHKFSWASATIDKGRRMPSPGNWPLIGVFGIIVASGDRSGLLRTKCLSLLSVLRPGDSDQRIKVATIAENYVEL